MQLQKIKYSSNKCLLEGWSETDQRWSVSGHFGAILEIHGKMYP